MMARQGRIIIADVPHHIAQRGNRRQDVFFCENDYHLYKSLMAEWRVFRGAA